jgi:hypothetical protein
MQLTTPIRPNAVNIHLPARRHIWDSHPGSPIRIFALLGRCNSPYHPQGSMMGAATKVILSFDINYKSKLLLEKVMSNLGPLT